MNLKLLTKYFVLFTVLLFPHNLSAQIMRQMMEKEPVSGASIFRPYFHDADKEVEISVGGGRYKPFYISHLGRHGARYYSQPNSWQYTFDCFETASSIGDLTEEGQSLYLAIKKIYDAHEGMYGELAPLGAEEHRGIAKRMFDRFKTVFTSRTRKHVRCVSSIYSRCLMSMANFSEELSSLAPDLEISFLAGKRYNNEYINSPIEYDFSIEANLILDSLKRSDLDPYSLISLYFNDSQVATSLISDLYAFEMGLYYFWAISYDLDFLGVDITSLIPIDELAKCSAIDNATKYAKVAVSAEFGKYTRVKGINMLKDFVAKAEDALQKDSQVAADLRFAHDSTFLPICALLGVEGYPICSIKEAYESWNAADAVPMCSNLQMVFYKGKRDVLVKVLVNEKETILTGLTPVYTVFYRWKDIKALIDGLECSDNETYNAVNHLQNNQLYE